MKIKTLLNKMIETVLFMHNTVYEDNILIVEVI